MKHILGRGIVALVAMAMTAACGSDATSAGSVSIKVVSADWSGWTEEQPEPETSTVTASPGSTFEVTTAVGTVEFSVVEVDGDHIELETDSALVPLNPGGGMDFDAATERFTLISEEPLQLGTPTTDAGTTVTLTVK